MYLASVLNPLFTVFFNPRTQQNFANKKRWYIHQERMSSKYHSADKIFGLYLNAKFSQKYSDEYGDTDLLKYFYERHPTLTVKNPAMDNDTLEAVADILQWIFNRLFFINYREMYSWNMVQRMQALYQLAKPHVPNPQNNALRERYIASLLYYAYAYHFILYDKQGKLYIQTQDGKTLYFEAFKRLLLDGTTGKLRYIAEFVCEVLDFLANGFESPCYVLDDVYEPMMDYRFYTNKSHIDDNFYEVLLQTIAFNQSSQNRFLSMAILTNYANEYYLEGDFDNFIAFCQRNYVPKRVINRVEKMLLNALFLNSRMWSKKYRKQEKENTWLREKLEPLRYQFYNKSFIFPVMPQVRFYEGFAYYR